MFRTAVVFLILAVLAAVLGFGSVVPTVTSIATLLFYSILFGFLVFLCLFQAGFAIALLLGLVTGGGTAS